MAAWNKHCLLPLQFLKMMKSSIICLLVDRKNPAVSHFLSHNFYFLNKPIMYGAACLLYGAATSDSVEKEMGSNRCTFSKLKSYLKLGSYHFLRGGGAVCL